jgi:hypothetical protein
MATGDTNQAAVLTALFLLLPGLAVAEPEASGAGGFELPDSVGTQQAPAPDERPAPPAEPVAPEATPAPPSPKVGPAPGETVIFPHFSVGLMGGGGWIGASADAGVRFHPILVAWSGWISGEGADYATFTGVKVGYVRQLSETLQGYGAIELGRLKHHFEDPTAYEQQYERGGTGFDLEAGMIVGRLRSSNILSVGARLVFPNFASRAPSGYAAEIPTVQVFVTVTPLALLLVAASIR